jgi:hypothetical protein
MTGLSAPEAHREETVRIVCLVISTLIIAIGAALVCFTWLDRPRISASPRPTAWIPSPQSGEHSFGQERP